MEKYSVSIAEVNNLFYKDGGDIPPLYEDVKTTRMAEGQIRVTLLQAALRNRVECPILHAGYALAANTMSCTVGPRSRRNDR